MENNLQQNILEKGVQENKKSSIFLLLFGGVFMASFYIIQRRDKQNNQNLNDIDENQNSLKSNLSGLQQSPTIKSQQNQQQNIKENNIIKIKNKISIDEDDSDSIELKEICCLHKFIKQENQQKNSIKVLLTTENKEKIQALKNVFKLYNSEVKLKNKVNFDIKSVKSQSGIPHGQPWGIQHTYEGANCRIQTIKNQNQEGQLKKYDMIVSIENGVFDILTHEKVHGFDICCVIIENLNNGEKNFSFSQGRQYPLDEVFNYKQQNVSNSQIGKNIAKFYQDNNNKLLSRIDQIEQCIFQVLKMYN